MAAYRFALRPRWIVSHLLVLTLVVVMVNLGFWQLRRLDDKRDFNRLVRDRGGEPVAPIDDVVDAAASFDGRAADAAVYRRVTARGTYDTEHEVLVRGRSRDGAPGMWVLTPLLVDDDSALVVNRGWVPAAAPIEGAPDEAAPPDGTTTVDGMLRATQRRARFGASDPGEGAVATLARADLDRYQQQLPYDIYPLWLSLEGADPPPADLPVPLPELDLSDGPHLGYAFQWFTFSAIAAGGYPMILRRAARDKAREARTS